MLVVGARLNGGRGGSKLATVRPESLNEGGCRGGSDEIIVGSLRAPAWEKWRHAGESGIVMLRMTWLCRLTVGWDS